MESSQAIQFAAAQCTVRAAGGKRRVPTFEMHAYAGGAMHIDTLPHPVVIVLAEAKFRQSATPILEDHDSTKRAGQTSSQRIDSKGVWASGKLSGAQGAGIAQEAADGFKFAASIGAKPESVDFVKAGQRTTVNGKTFPGPIFVARRTEIFEISILAIGADASATVSIAAQHKGLTPMSKKINGTPAEPLTITDDTATTNRTAVADEELRCDSIRAAAKKFEHVDPAALADQLGEDVTDLATAKHHAIAAGLSGAEFELACLRASRSNTRLTGPFAPRGGAFNINKGPQHYTDRYEPLEAALAIRAGVPDIEKHYSPQALEAAAAGNTTCLLDVCRALAADSGLPTKDHDSIIRAAISTSDLGRITSNVAGKSALAAYQSFPSVARQIAKSLSVVDFKTNRAVRVVTDDKLAELAPDGQITYGSLGDMGFDYSVRTVARNYGISRVDIVNDDTSALSDIPRAMARQAASNIESDMFQLLLNNPVGADGYAFFSTEHGNEITPALGIAGLDAAFQSFFQQLGPEGTPINVMPQSLVVAPAEWSNARALLISPTVLTTDTTGAQAQAMVPTSNPLQNQLAPLVSPWLSAGVSYKANGAAGLVAVSGDDNGWFVFGPATDTAAVGIAYLRGQTNPTVRYETMSPDRLGLTYTAFHDYACVLLDYRGGLHSSGSA